MTFQTFLDISADVFGSTKQCEIQIQTSRMKLSIYDLLSRYMRILQHLLFLFSVKRLLIVVGQGTEEDFQFHDFFFSHFTLHFSNAQRGISSLLLIRVNSLKNLIGKESKQTINYFFETFLCNILFLSDVRSIIFGVFVFF
jgi:hypothetical protein